MNLPFHPEPGIQISILMSESLVGFNVAATRQKVGRLLNNSPGPLDLGQGWNQQLAEPAKSCGKANAPGATVCAIVIVVSGRESEERFSQVAAAKSGELSMFIKIAANIASGSFIGPPFQAPRKRNTKTR